MYIVRIVKEHTVMTYEHVTEIYPSLISPFRFRQRVFVHMDGSSSGVACYREVKVYGEDYTLIIEEEVTNE